MGNDFKLKEGGFRVDIGKKFCYDEGAKTLEPTDFLAR